MAPWIFGSLIQLLTGKNRCNLKCTDGTLDAILMLAARATEGVTMMTRKLILLGLLANTVAQAGDQIYSCVEEQSTSIGWQQAKLFTGRGMRAETSVAKDPMTVTLVVHPNGATMKGNVAQVELVKLNDHTWVEETDLGAIVNWTLLVGTNGIPTYLIQQKAYALMGPFTITTAYMCK